MIFSLIKLIVLLVGIYFFGWQFCRRALKQNEIYLLIPLAWSIGVSFYIFVLNILAYLLGIRISFTATLALLVIAAFILKYKLDAENTTRGINKKYFRLVLAASLLVAVLYIPIFFTSYSWDERWHGPLISTITEGNFPVTSPFVPGSEIFYHYGVDIWISAIQYFTGFPLPVANAAAVSALLVFIFWLSFAVLHKITKNPTAAFLASFLLFFGGGIRYLLISADINCGECIYAWDYLKGITHIFFSSPSKINLDHFFHPYSVDTFGVYVYRRSALLAFLSSLTIIQLGYLDYKYSKWFSRIALVIVFSVFALAEETYFAIFLAAWILWQLLIYLRDRSRRMTILQSLIFVLAGVLVVIFLQGGVFTSLLQSKITGNASAGNSSFSLRAIPGVISFGGFYPFNKIRSWLFFIIEWGLPLVIFPVAWFYLRRKRNIFLSWLAITAVVGLAVAFFINYDTQPREMSRVNAYAFWFMNIITGIGLGFWYSEKKLAKKVIIILLAIMMISPLTFSLRKWPIHQRLLPVLIEEGVDLTIQEEVAKRARQIVPADEAVLTALPLAVTQLWGRVGYFGAPEGLDVLQRNVKKNLGKIIIDENFRDLLAEKNVTYIYSDPELNFIFSQNNKKLLETIDLEEVYRYDNEYALYKIK